MESLMYEWFRRKRGLNGEFMFSVEKPREFCIISSISGEFMFPRYVTNLMWVFRRRRLGGNVTSSEVLSSRGSRHRHWLWWEQDTLLMSCFNKRKTRHWPKVLLWLQGIKRKLVYSCEMVVRVAGIYDNWLTLTAYQKLSFWMNISKSSRKYSASQLGNHGDVRPCRNTSAMEWKWVAVGVRRTHRWERKKIQIIPVQAKRTGNLLFWRFLNSFISCVASPCEPGQGHPDSNHVPGF